MQVKIYPDSQSLARAAATDAASLIHAAIERTGKARIVAASAASQIEFLAALVRSEAIDWSRVEVFQLDEYIGLPATHPARFSEFLLRHLVAPAGISTFHSLTETKAARLCRILTAHPVDVAFVGIGENAHLAFNDPPADFVTEQPYIVVPLDQACRQQQVDEGWFPTLTDVPETAVSMSVNQILKASEILAIVPDLRKARAVRACLEGPIRPEAPASALRKHPKFTIYLDHDSASLLRP